jgi:curli biogenesis system outer membrane secretion channel CsgG
LYKFFKKEHFQRRIKLNKYYISIIGLLFLVQACATVEKYEVEVVDEQKPQISKVFTEEVAETFLKRKVAISRFSNETKYGQSFLLDEQNDRIGKQAMDILSAKLAATDKFILLERADIEKINEELARGAIENLSINADYLILGSISEFGRKTHGKVGIFSRTKKQVAYARVNIRLVDIYTGQIIYSEEAEGEAFSEAGSVLGVGERAGYDSTLNDKVISAAISKLVNNIVENLLDKPWRSYILSYDEGSYIVAGGKSQGVKKNDIFGVYKKGKKVKNPQTNMFIELPGKLIGKVQVNQLIGNRLSDEISLCSVVKGNVPMNKFSTLFIQEMK